MNIQRIIQDAAQMGAAQLAVNLGLTSGEMSQRKARTCCLWKNLAREAGRRESRNQVLPGRGHPFL